MPKRPVKSGNTKLSNNHETIVKKGQGAKDLAIAFRHGMGLSVPTEAISKWTTRIQTMTHHYGRDIIEVYFRLVFILVLIGFSCWIFVKASISTMDTIAKMLGGLIDQFWEYADDKNGLGDLLRKLPLPSYIVRNKTVKHSLKELCTTAVGISTAFTISTMKNLGLTLSWVVLNPLNSAVLGVVMYATPKPRFLKAIINDPINSYLTRNISPIIDRISANLSFLPSGGAGGAITRMILAIPSLWFYVAESVADDVHGQQEERFNDTDAQRRAYEHLTEEDQLFNSYENVHYDPDVIRLLRRSFSQDI